MKIKIIQIITIIFLILSVVLVYEAFNIYPDIGIMEEKIKNQELVVSNSKDILKRVEELVAFTEGNKIIVDKFDSVLPVNDDKANLLSSLDSLARLNNLSTHKISFNDNTSAQQAGVEGTEINTGDFDTRTIKLSLRGSYASFKNFLDAIEKNVRVMDIVSVDLTPNPTSKEEEAGLRFYSYSIVLKTYIYKPSRAENASRLFSSGRFKNFSVDSLNFVNEKVFKSLQLPSNYNIDTGADEIGNQDIF